MAAFDNPVSLMEKEGRYLPAVSILAFFCLNAYLFKACGRNPGFSPQQPGLESVSEDCDSSHEYSLEAGDNAIELGIFLK